MHKNKKDICFDEQNGNQNDGWAEGKTFSRRQQLLIPPWLNKQTMTGNMTDKRAEDSTELWNDLTDEGWCYVRKLQEEAEQLQILCLALGGMLILFTALICFMYWNGWIIH